MPGVPSLLFLCYILLFLPGASMRSAVQLRHLVPSQAVRRAIWIGSAVNLLVLLFASILVGWSFDDPFFAKPRVDARSILAAIVALAACFVLRAISEAIRSEDEHESMLVRLLVPHSKRDWLIWTPLVLLAGVAEELAYRGVGVAILVDLLDVPWLAILISATAFAAAHALQGWKSGVIIFAIALVMHALVAITGTLVYAMIIHAVYDLVVGYFIGREAVAEHGTI